MNQHDPDSEPPGTGTAEDSRSAAHGIAHWLIRHAARSAPGPLARRLEEEWLADLAARDSAISELRFALGCFWASHVIAHEYCAAAVAIASPASGEKLTLSKFDGETGLVPRHWTTVIVVIAIHIAIFYALTAGLGVSFNKLISTPFRAQILPDGSKPVPPPSLPHPTLTEVRIDARIPEIPPPPSDPEERVLADPQPLIGALPLPPVVPSHSVSRVPGGPGTGFPNTDDFYPSAAKYLNEQGIATVRVCVDPSGRLTSLPTTMQGTGSPRLDAGALALARAGSGHYRPSTEDGRAVDSCYAFRVRFQLRTEDTH
ncbi:MAG: TonB family protein [Steroidobacteraceae bacterium]|jgi:TonB family protein